MSRDIREDKRLARIEVRRRVAALDPTERRRSARALCGRLKASTAWREARCLLAYLAFGAELDLDPLIRDALDEGKEVYVPRIDGPDMEFRRLTSLDGPFDPGPFGIRTPRADRPRWMPLAVPGPALTAVPGLAFDASGRRLGRGGGYYDRFIENVRRECRAVGESPPSFIGCAYPEQVVPALPWDDHDAVLDGLVTEDGLRVF